MKNISCPKIFLIFLPSDVGGRVLTWLLGKLSSLLSRRGTEALAVDNSVHLHRCGLRCAMGWYCHSPTRIHLYFFFKLIMLTRLGDTLKWVLDRKNKREKPIPSSPWALGKRRKIMYQKALLPAPLLDKTDPREDSGFRKKPDMGAGQVGEEEIRVLRPLGTFPFPWFGFWEKIILGDTSAPLWGIAVPVRIAWLEGAGLGA